MAAKINTRAIEKQAFLSNTDEESKFQKEDGPRDQFETGGEDNQAA